VGSRLRREGLECWLRTRRRNALTREERKMGARRWRVAARGQVPTPLRRSCLASRGLPVVRVLGSRRRREFRGGGRHGGGIPIPGVQGVSTSVSLPAMQGAGVRELGTSQGPVTSDVRRKSNELRCGVSGRPGRPLELHPKLMRRRRTTCKPWRGPLPPAYCLNRISLGDMRVTDRRGGGKVTIANLTELKEGGAAGGIR
jgi:hypothetical protein